MNAGNTKRDLLDLIAVLKEEIVLLKIENANLRLGHQPVPDDEERVEALTDDWPPVLRHGPRVLAISVLLLGCALSAACAKRVHVDPRPAIVRDTYLIQESVKPDIYFVWLAQSATRADLARAKREIGCGICIDTPSGTVIQVERFRRTK